VEFESEEVADKVMSKKQNSKMGDQELTLDYVGSKSLNAKQSQPIIHDPSTTLFVKQLNYETTVDGLKAAFSSCVDMKLGTFPDTGKSRGFAFISYSTAEEASADLVRMNGCQLDGRSIVVGFARTPAENAAKKSQNNKKKHEKGTKKKTIKAESNATNSNLTKQKRNDKQKKKLDAVASAEGDKPVKPKTREMQVESSTKKKKTVSDKESAKKKMKL